MSTIKLLAPVVCIDAADVGNAAFNGVRRRPVVAINEDGNLVVCCRRTASKNGWKLQGTLHQRPRSNKKVTIAPNGKLVLAETPARRKMDQADQTVVSKTKLKEVAEQLTELL